jgi:hypothetical protein
MANALLEAALSYASRGWKVFPLQVGGKFPLIPKSEGGRGFLDATTDEGQIRSWWEREPRANIGIATGPDSNLVVLDFDNKNGGLGSYTKLCEEHGDFVTLGVHTGGGGLHFYYAYPQGFVVRNKQGLFPGTDIRASGGYICAPPSLHESGEEYRWLADELSVPLVAALPMWLEQLVIDTVKPSSAPVSSVTLPEGQRGDLAKATLKFILFGAEPGTWHAQLFKAAMDLKQQGYEYEEALEKLESSGHVMDESHDVPLLLDVWANREPRHPPRMAPTGSAQPEQLSERFPEAPLSNGTHPGALGADTQLVSLNVPVISYLDDMFRALSDPNKVKGIATGVEGIDGLLGGGKRFGELTVTMATAKTGKSSLYAFLIHQLLQRGESVGYASREMRPDSEVIPNLLSIEHSESVLDLAIKGKLSDAHKKKYKESVAKWPLHFASGYGPFPLESFRRWTHELRAQGVKWFFIDHLHYCLAEEDDWGESVSLVRALKTLTIENDIHIDLIVQPTKVQEGMRLGLNSLKGGSGIGQALDNLFFLEHTGTANVRELTLDRARFPLANPGKIFLQYDKGTRRFIEVEPQQAPEPPPQGAGPQGPRPNNTFSRYQLDG